ncbi:MAG TPA: hypothetical protein VLS96_18365 [Nodosilinea sp.]|nr:hypothetical protein [Nodosilinea sp.]
MPAIPLGNHADPAPRAVCDRPISTVGKAHPTGPLCMGEAMHHSPSPISPMVGGAHPTWNPKET